MGCMSSTQAKVEQMLHAAGEANAKVGALAARVVPMLDDDGAPDARIEEGLLSCKPILDALHISDDAGRIFFKAFDTIDATGSGVVKYNEFISRIAGVKESKFTRRCFDLIDDQRTGKFSFAQVT